MISKKNMHQNIAVIGAGQIGMLAALNLAHKGHSVSLIGPPAKRDELRTTAIMMPTIHMLQALNIWDTLKCHAAALSSIRIIDTASRIIRAPTVNFRSIEIGEKAFGYNIPNLKLNDALINTIKHTPNIKRFFSLVKDFNHQKDHICIILEDGQVIKALLVVAADGRSSPTRAAAGINIKQWNYPQIALVFNFLHNLPHQNISTEFYTKDGLFTQVPLLGNKSSLVWIGNPSRAKELLNMELEGVAKMIENQMQSILGEIKIETKIQTWPLLGLIPDLFAANGIILVGESAHVFPPIGAQGFNLGIRDVQTLVDLIPDEISTASLKEITANYNQHRKSDIFIRSGFVHILSYALLSNMLPVHVLRSAGLELLRNCSPLRHLFMREGMDYGYGFKTIMNMLTTKSDNN
ncbi:UbiH/UbiF family hydroxylase [Bartonella sp. 1-1C]|uniref:UbiH/UbiF family hydroxylase n=1 Tax=Bartonella sp. 1-1C TaxID=515256 RepID=UPI000C059BFF|nr:UbiH/UbiF family hydroxylase [Bartonella sp. 1-1C]ATO57398.1 2-octaprenyl-3-methyl-6-methoxy-1,4-benzoquinol hydroxylase [Bartonella sp. 1-1C]